MGTRFSPLPTLQVLGITESRVKRTSGLDEIEAALKRATYQAVYGTREERSGRFLPTD
jgi:hypothetical protein